MNHTPLDTLPSPPATLMPAARPVEIRDSLSQEAFQDFMHPVGKPVILLGGMREWPAMREWTFEWFRRQYGRDRIEIMDSLYHTKYLYRVRLHEYLEYLESPEGTELYELEQELGLSAPFYAYGYKPFRKHPELLQAFSFPDFVEHWSPHFSARFTYVHFPHWHGWIFFAPRGALSKLHTDPGATMLWHSQISGRKRCLLFSPLDSPYLYEGKVDPLHSDLERFPAYQQARPFECVLEPGSMLFLPPHWWHHVVALEPSITLSYNLVNRINFGYYVAECHKSRLPKWLARLPIEPREKVIRKAVGSIPGVRRLRRFLRPSKVG